MDKDQPVNLPKTSTFPVSGELSLSDDFDGAKPVMALEFTLARNTLVQEKAQQESFGLRQDEIKLGNDQLTGEQVSRPVNKARIAQGGHADKQRKDKADRGFFMALLDQLRDRLADLETQMAESYKILQEKYDGDVTAGIRNQNRNGTCRTIERRYP